MTTEDNSAYVPKPSVYGRFIRERGTRRVVMLFAGVAALWYAYGAFSSYRLNQVKWPTLNVELAGLTVLGLRDRARADWTPRYKAFEVNKDWQIRRPEEEVGEEQADGPSESTPESQDRGNDPAASGRGSRGAIVPLEEVMANCPTVLLGRHFVSAAVEQRPKDLFDRYHYAVHLRLTPEGSSRYWQFSRDHDDERLVFVLDKDIITCPRMKHMNVSSLTIEPIWVKEDADKLADFINTKRPAVD